MKPSSIFLHKTLVYSLLLFLTSTSAQAQFYNSVEGNTNITVGPRDSIGNFYYLMDNVIVKVDASNQNVLWRKWLNAAERPAIYLSDTDSSSNLIVTTYGTGLFTEPFLVQAISPGGTLVWTKELTTAANVLALGYLHAKDKSIYLGGSGVGLSNPSIKLDGSGNLLWSKNYQGNLSGGYIGGILEKKNGNLYVVGYNWKQDTAVIKLFEIDPMGSLQWHTCYKLPGSDNGGGDVVNAKLTDKDEVIVFISASIQGQPMSPLLMKADSVGTLKWAKKINRVNATTTFSYDMDLDVNNKILICTHSIGSALKPFGIFRFSSDSCKLLNAVESDRIALSSVKAFSPNKYVLSGLVLESGKGIIAQLDSTLGGLCDLSTTTADVVDFPMPPLQTTFMAFTFSTTVTSTVGAFYTANSTRYEACTEIVGIGDVNKNLIGTLHLYPNPADATVFIETEEASELQIRNQLSQLVLQQQLELGKNTVDISKLPIGIYYVSSIGSNGLKQYARLAVE